MNSYKAKRLSLAQAIICDSLDRPVSSISWPTVQIWSCENTAIGDPYFQDKSLGAYPLLNINETTFTARRKLLTNNFFRNEYEISLWDEGGEIKISAFRPGGIWRKTKITYQEKTYYLSRKKLFKFLFVLQRSELEISRSIEVTPFFTFSSYREFLIFQDEPVDLLLLTFVFFLSHNEFF